MRIATPDEVRAAIAAHVLGSAPDRRVLGAVHLHQHQCEAVRRLGTIIRANGGALLADEVGLGKTFVALALAADFGRPTIVAPASLRPMWRAASARAAVETRFVSMERLGHGGTVPPTDYLIVDEAHHFRNPQTRRHGQLAEACARSVVLLLTATPVQNSLRDLRTLLGLLLGRQADALDATELGKLIVRRSASAVQATAPLPTIAEPKWITVAADVDCLDQLCRLPPPVPPADGDHASALAVFSLARQWASSRAALMAALTRRLAAARAMEDALAAGKLPTRAELRAWRYADGIQQLAFPELGNDYVTPAAAMLPQIRSHADGLRSLIAWLRCQPDVDRDRAEQLLAITQRHPGERVVAFAEFIETVATLYRQLAPRCRVAMLTASGGRVAGGALTRREVLEQFASAALGADRDRIDLLLATDVLSEGVDLQGASTVVHLDLTWNPARMEQRVGRLRRFGAARDSVTVYVFAPPAPADRLLQLDRRLREKLGEAARSIGLAGAILPGLSPSSASVVSEGERVVDALESWLGAFPAATPLAAAVACEQTGALACVRNSGEVLLVALHDGRVSLDPSGEFLRSVSGAEPAFCEPEMVASALQQIESWLQRRSFTDVVQLSAAHVARSRHGILKRVNGIAARARRHERRLLSELLGAARRAATVPMPAGAERVLDQLAVASLSDEAWLRAVGEFGAIHGRTRGGARDEVLALLLLVPAP